jgi:hypothetical protein
MSVFLIDDIATQTPAAGHRPTLSRPRSPDAESRQGRCRLNGDPGSTSRAFGSSRCVYSRL